MQDRDMGGDTQIKGPYYVLARHYSTRELEIESGWSELEGARERADDLKTEDWSGVAVVKLIGAPPQAERLGMRRVAPDLADVVKKLTR